MISKLVLSEIIKDQLVSVLRKQWIERDKEIPLKTKKIVIVSGVRRCGKSTLIQQKLLKMGNALYLNLEAPRLINFTMDDFPKLYVFHQKATGKSQKKFQHRSGVCKSEQSFV